MAQTFITVEQFEAFKTETLTQYEQTRKLMTKQAVAIEQKLQQLQSQFEMFSSRKPDPTIIRDAWIRQVPKIREELQQLQLQVGRLSSMVNPQRQGVK